MISELIYLIGAIKLFEFMWKVRVYMQRHLHKPSESIEQRYGKGSWVLVTGASDGMGAEYCRQLAARGFNIVLVSRTLSKLQSVAKEVQTANP